MSDILPEKLQLLEIGFTGFPTDVTISFVNGVYVVYILNYEAVENNAAVQEMVVVRVGGEVVTLGDIAKSEPFRVLVDRLTKQVYNPGSRLVIHINATKHNEEVKIQMSFATVLNEMFQGVQVVGKSIVIKNGVKIRLKNETIVISIPDLVECPVCGKAFTQNRSNQVYCSVRCGTRLRNRHYQRRKRREKIMT